MEPIVFPDVEAVLEGWLEDALADTDLAGVQVSTRVPNPRPERFVRIQRTGGPRLNLVTDAAQVTFECWATSGPQAADDAALLRAVLLAARNVRTPSGALIHRVVEFSGPALLPDVSDQPRYSFTHQIHLRGIPL